MATSAPAGIHIPRSAWWFLALVGLAVRMAFILKGNIAFDSDEAYHYAHVEWLMTGRMADYQGGVYLAGLREALACLFYRLTGGWAYSGCLGAVILTALFSAMWVLWLHRKVSPVAALGAAMFFAFPPFSEAYFSTHLEERRIETIWWGTLLVFFSDQWPRQWWTALLFGGIIGWAYWCEPFVLFFALPVAAYGLWKRKEPGRWIPALFVAGSAAGLLLGYLWNDAFTRLGPIYLHWAPKDWKGIEWNLSLLWNVFPQFWNGNFPFGYLQNSGLGRYLDPLATTWAYPGFLSLWTFLTFSFGSWGSARWVFQKDPGLSWSVFLCALPAFFYLAFFAVGSQIWDATSFRYAAFWEVGAAVGFGFGVHFMSQKGHQAAIGVLILWAVVQSLILGGKFQKISPVHPAQAVIQGFRAAGLNRGYADHWVGDACRYLSGDELVLAGYTGSGPGSESAWKAVHEAGRIGVADLDGLDDPQKIKETLRQLGTAGYRIVKIRPMVGDWKIIEMDRGRPSP